MLDQIPPQVNDNTCPGSPPPPPDLPPPPDDRPFGQPTNYFLGPRGELVSRVELMLQIGNLLGPNGQDKGGLEGWHETKYDRPCPRCGNTSNWTSCFIAPAGTFVACRESHGEGSLARTLEDYDTAPADRRIIGIYALDSEVTLWVGNKPLTRYHHRELREAGLSDDDIREAGLYDEARPAEVARLLNWRRGSHMTGACLVIRYDGDYCRLKFQLPREDKEGKPVKYEAPRHRGNRLYFPPRTVPLLDDASQDLFLTEGEKKALAATRWGFPCVGLPGVYGWRGKGGPVEDLDAVAWEGRKARIVFDSDVRVNELVRKARSALANELTRRGAEVLVVDLQPGPGGEKVGVDDFLATQGTDAFRRLVADARPAGVDGTYNDPHVLATSYLEKTRPCAGERGLRQWRESWWEYQEGSYAKVSARYVNGRLTASVKADFDERFAGKAVPHVTTKVVSNAAQALGSLALLHDAVEQPCWVGPGPDVRAGEIMVMNNGLFHPQSYAAGRECFWPHTSNLFASGRLGFDFDRRPPEPAAWLQFMDDLWGKDPESVLAMQAVMGWFLAGDTRLQKIVMLLGLPRSGKGTIARILAKLLGEWNVVWPSLSSLAGNFGGQQLLGKKAAFIPDMRVPKVADVTVALERLLSISGEDAQTVDVKHNAPVTGRLKTRFMVLTNMLPELKEPSTALASRVFLLRFTKSFAGKEDKHLEDKLSRELMGIMLWALDGYRSVAEAGELPQPRTGRVMLEEWLGRLSPVARFVAEACDLSEPKAEIAVADLFFAFEVWCRNNDVEGDWSSSQFGKELLDATSLDPAKQKKVGGRIVGRFYRGIGLKKEWVMELPENHPVTGSNAG